MNSEKARQLIKKYNDGKCSAEEIEMLENWFIQYNEQDIEIPQARIEAIGQDIFKKLPEKEKKSSTNLWPLVAAIAAIVIIISTWLINPLGYTSIYSKEVADIAPGGNKATLMLSNGQSIPLSVNQQGIIVGSEKISYNDGTKIPVADLTAIQTITTPKGGQYQIELPEGTKVWLNSSSVVQYAANLNIESGERKFRLIAGEAYFEISKDKNHPFIVSTLGQKVQVLGTHFNINAYSPETAIKTTLLEGSVKISSKDNKLNQVMIPGQQASYTGNDIRLKQVDLELETAWKRGKTEFEDADLSTVMQMLERWYDIETIYQTKNTESRFTGTISRSKNISAVLKLLESTGEVHFKLEGRTVIVMK